MSAEPVTREPLHHRQIDMRVCKRSDGLFEASAHLTDTKSHDLKPDAGDLTFAAGSPIHDMRVTLIFDIDMIVRGVETFMASHPYASCPGGGDSLNALIGVQIGAGWNSKVRAMLPNCDTCTHLKELLTPLATAAIQGMVGLRASSLQHRNSDGKPSKIDSCHGYSATRELVKIHWPEYYRPALTDSAK
ncbi:DUF2889 domain-containing protein [Caballeronia sp. BR00000012568055]|uniref:DUF2889 domain-containing protein n=1 Tax=Caballeronia sp. BR00000012568055 TaxID=2918761 RepID=UPI0023FA1C99|nr:DUF2889 domain-containing protein [Caballeronia sp. BR00000012568055]